MKPHSKKGFICLKMMMKIPMTVFGGLQYDLRVLRTRISESVSIPMTVFGGLQCLPSSGRRLSLCCFNTDDGIWRATMIAKQGKLIIGNHKFQYR